MTQSPQVSIRWMTLLLLVGFFSSLGACSQDEDQPRAETYQTLSVELAEKMDEYAAVFPTVTDLASAEEAVGRIETLGDEFVAIAKRFETLGTPTDEQRQLISSHLLPAQQRMNDAWMALLDRVTDSAALVTLGDAFSGFGEKISQAQKIIHQ